jgi:hypothetical protein
MDVKKLIDEISKSVSKNVEQTLVQHKDFIEKLAADEFVALLKNIVNREKFDADVFQHLLSQLSDEQFLALRKKTVESAQEWAALNAQKTKIVTDLMSNITQQVANLIIRQVLIGM